VDYFPDIPIRDQSNMGIAFGHFAGQQAIESSVVNAPGVKRYWQGAKTGPSRCRGLTLIEVMITVVIVALIASIALPSYQQYIVSSRARTAAADLMALATAFENRCQRQLSYAAGGTTTASTA